MNSLLLVCEGNICRSPMAAGIISAALPGVRVQSAGLGALVGVPADPEAVRLMAARGIDIAAHRGTQIQREICLRAELILVMEQMQRHRLEQMYPPVRGRVFRLLEHTGTDVPDPYRKPEEVFRYALRQIDEGVEHWLRRIKRTQESWS